MDRSSHIYIAFNHADELLGAWTVKHELMTYARRDAAKRDKDYQVKRVIRVRDSQGAGEAQYQCDDITTEIALDSP